MLHFDTTRPPVPPRPAATLILLRDAPADGGGGVEVLFMQRSLQSSFMGGAVVFPGGRVEPSDAEWDTTVAPALRSDVPWNDADGRAARIAACREALEEVGVVPLFGSPVGPDAIEGLRRAASEGPASLRDALASSRAGFDLSGLVPYARWVTPEAEPKRFDARFFVARAPAGQEARSDQKEAVRVGWATPRELLRGFDAGELTLFPPTHRTLWLLAQAEDTESVIARAHDGCLDEIRPRFNQENGRFVLALPGDPAHEIATPRVSGPSRFVLREARWVPEDAPAK
jgi:8-oxo-dGTP pyrophosphatase MutT (NUDIX family)